LTYTFADTSALARCYFPDEPDTHALREQLLSGGIVTASELVRVELRRAIAAAARAGRIRGAARTWSIAERDLAAANFRTLSISEPVLRSAERLVEHHPLGTLDALHLSTALSLRDALVPDDEIVFVTRDRVQADAARAEGLTVA
jgi:predicted nucleic acid-binding protein